MRQDSRSATTHAGQGSGAQQSCFIDEIIDITVSVQTQKPSESKRFQRTTEVPQSADPEDLGDSIVEIFIRKIMEVPQVSGFRRTWRFPSFQYTVKMVDDAAEISEDSADATGPVH